MRVRVTPRDCAPKLLAQADARRKVPADDLSGASPSLTHRYQPHGG
jgi:hypothetical protein